MQSRFRGVMLGGAVGDALGAPVEFMRLDAIKKKFGSTGVRGFEPCYGRKGAITDDTQMSLFCGEGLLRAWNYQLNEGLEPDYEYFVGNAMLRWLHTQGVKNSHVLTHLAFPGWLMTNDELFSCRAPGNTCLSSLSAMRSPTWRADNDSKGCGAVMRTAPVGLFCYHAMPEKAFQLADALGAQTHGHATGHLTGGFLASLVQQLLRGTSLPDALAVVTDELKTYPDHAETLAAVELAIRLAGTAIPTEKAIQMQGEGWIAEEALGIAIYCALMAKNFTQGVLLGANHSGDTDSTAAIAGNILGAIHGDKAIPLEWLNQLELVDVITQLADDLYTFPIWSVNSMVNETYPPR
ncbi:ADP-ribosylglycohydrolase family protein [Salmonella enterica]|nr:ADP-ribosylglycohydrolase family protein [Salmonella enterica]